MKTAKKLVSLLTVMVLAISLCACGSKEESKPAQGNTSEPAQSNNPGKTEDKSSEEKYRDYAMELYKDECQTYLVSYDIHNLSYVLDTPDMNWLCSYLGTNHKLDSLLEFNFLHTDVEASMKTDHDKLLHYQILTCPYSKDVTLYEDPERPELPTDTVYYNWYYRDYDGYMGLYMKSNGQEDQINDGYGANKKIAYTIPGIKINGKSYTLIDGYFTYSSEKVQSPLDDAVFQCKCDVSAGMGEEQYDGICTVEQTFAEILANNKCPDLSTIETTSYIQYAEILGSPVLFYRSLSNSHSHIDDPETEERNNDEISTWAVKMELQAISLSETPLTDLMYSFVYDLDDESRKQIDYIGYYNQDICHDFCNYTSLYISSSFYGYNPMTPVATVDFSVHNRYNEDAYESTEDLNKFVNTLLGSFDKITFGYIDKAENQVKLDFLPKQWYGE